MFLRAGWMFVHVFVFRNGYDEGAFFAVLLAFVAAKARDENEGIRERATKGFAKGVRGIYYSTVVGVSYTELVR